MNSLNQQRDNMKKVGTLITLFYLLSIAPYLKGQPVPPLPLKKVAVNTINYEQGLLSNDLSAIITDTLGFTWVGSSAGLQRYNGYLLERIKPIIGHDTIQIKSHVYLFRLKSGALWISYKKGILEYNPFTNKFRHIITASNTSDVLFSTVPLLETPEGVWCLGEGMGVIIYDKNGHIKTKIPSIETRALDEVIGSFHLKDKGIITAGQNHIYIRTGLQKLLDINTSNHQIDQISGFDNQITGIGCNNMFFYVCTNQSISKFSVPDRNLVKKYHLANITSQLVTYCGIHAVGNNRLIANVNNLVLEFDEDLNRPKLLVTFNSKPLLVAGRVQRIYNDAYGRIWLLTNDDIKRIQDKGIPFDYLKYPNATNNFVRSLYFDEQEHKLLAGCFNGGLQLYDSTSVPLWQDHLQTKEVADVTGITKLTPNNYLIITLTRGWFLLDLKKKKLTAFNFSLGEKWRDLLYNNTFSDNFQRLNDSTLIIACVSNVYRCIFHGNRLISAKPLLPADHTNDNWISTCYVTSDRSLWAGDYSGQVFKLSPDGQLEKVIIPERAGVRCFTEDAEHHTWMGTNSGLHVFDQHGRLLKSFYTSSGLLNDCIYSLLPGPGKSEIFASSNMGLSDITLSGNIKNYTKAVGLQDNEFNTSAALITSSGRYYFGGINGISAFYPSALKMLGSKPVLNMIKLVANDSSYNSSGIWRGDTVRVKYNQNYLQFDFAGMGMLNADQYFYKYRMTGFGNWQSTHQPTGIRYILQPGNYMLEVTCSNELPGPEVKKNIIVIIDPPFWLRWWFFILIGIFVLAAIISIVSSYNRRKYEKRLQELRIKQSLQTQRERLSRDLHDNLGAQANAIFYGTELLKLNKIPGEKLINNLQDTAKDMLTVLRETLWAMKATRTDTTGLWMRIVNFSSKIATSYPLLKIIVSGTPPTGYDIEPSAALNIILISQEAINNAVRHSGSGSIEVDSFVRDDAWCITITDKGKGFNPAEIMGKSETYGMENMTSRARESNLQLDINSEPNGGTRIILKIKLSEL